MPRRSVILAGLAIVLAGCTAQATPVGASATAGPSLVTTEHPTAAPASLGTGASPSVGPSASVAVMELPEGDQHVFPGTYTTHFQPALTLTVGHEVELSCAPGFKCRGDVSVNRPGWLNLGFGDAPAFEVSIVRIDKVFASEPAGKLIDPPKDLVRWIAALPGVTVIAPPKTVKVGGLDSTQVDVRSGDKEVRIGPISGLAAPGAFAMGPHDFARLIAVDVDGHQVVVRVDVVGPDAPGFVATPAQFRAATEALQPLVDSIVWR